MDPKNNPLFKTQKPKRFKKPTSLAEALLEIGGQSVKSFGKDVVAGTTADAIRTVTSGGRPARPVSGDLMPGRGLEIDEQLRQKEQEIRQQEQARLRHKEVQEFGVYDRLEEETKLQIKALQDELKKLAKELGSLGAQVQKAVEEEVVQPGTYHVTFFEKLRSFILQLRKKVSESKNWLALSQARKQKHNFYWGMVKKSGTKFMLSQERYMSTQAG